MILFILISLKTDESILANPKAPIDKNAKFISSLLTSANALTAIFRQNGEAIVRAFENTRKSIDL